MVALHDIYAAQLSQLHHGFPLWSPEPWAPGEEVRTGDVGFIRRGQFRRLFNTFVDGDHPYNERRGVPDNFVPLRPPPYTTSYIEKFFDAGDIMQSSSILKLELAASATGSVFPAGGGVRFTCSDKYGAVLMLKRATIREDTIAEEEFKDYIQRYYTDWYTFANDRLRCGVQAGELILVTGCDKTAEWTSATFANRRRDASISFSGGVISVASGEIAISGTWETNTAVSTRTGPSCGDTVVNNQAIFVRGYKMLKRPFRKVAPTMLQAAAEPQPPGPREPEADSSAVLSPDSSIDSDATVERLTEEQSGFHPSDALLEWELQHTSDDMVIIHDNDWCKPRRSHFMDGGPNISVSDIVTDYARRHFEDAEYHWGADPSDQSSEASPVLGPRRPRAWSDASSLSSQRSTSDYVGFTGTSSSPNTSPSLSEINLLSSEGSVGTLQGDSPGSPLSPVISLPRALPTASPHVSGSPSRAHWRMALNNHVQRTGNAIQYDDSTSGPVHAPTWQCRILVNGTEHGRAQGKSRFEARERAAAAAVRSLMPDQP